MSDAGAPQFRIRTLLVATGVKGLILAAWVHWPFVSSERIHRVQPGMPPAEVIAIMGEPNSRGDIHWVWDRWPPGGVAVVEFSDGHVVDAFND